MIQPKLKECSVCGKLSRLWQSSPKMCKDCAMKQKSSTQGLKTGINPGKQKPLRDDQKKFRSDLNVFFASQTLNIPDFCENCQKPLGVKGFSSFERRCVIAHILEKSQHNGFPSVSCHPQNRMFLGVRNCNCHTQWDGKGAEYRSQMPVYKIAMQRFEQFKHLLTDKELVKASTYLNTSWQ